MAATDCRLMPPLRSLFFASMPLLPAGWFHADIFIISLSFSFSLTAFTLMPLIIFFDYDTYCAIFH
jgi:hypothetical protein